jgi:hypothetical protein
MCDTRVDSSKLLSQQKTTTKKQTIIHLIQQHPTYFAVSSASFALKT